MRCVWIDATAGIAGDMLLGALLDAGADPDFVTRCVQAVSGQLEVRVERTTRHQLDAAKVTIVDSATGRAADACDSHHSHDHDHEHGHAHTQGQADAHPHGHGDAHTHGHPGDHHHRPWRVVRDMIVGADLPGQVEALAQRTFEVLARAEGAVHGIAPEEVEFHEVGSLDAIGDVVGVCAALVDLAPQQILCSTVTVGYGEQVLGAHGRIPIPGPAVTHMVREARIAVASGPLAMETATPTGVALLAALCDESGVGMPAMVLEATGLGAGTRDPDRVANVVRAIVGTGAAASGPAADAGAQIVLSTNVDDMDPRLWPEVIAQLMEAGAADAWLSPILMKKGRPAHTLHVLADAAQRTTMLGLIAAHTSAIGARETPVTKHALEREFATVEIAGHPIAVKIARFEGRVVNAQPEFRDVEAAARARGVPVRTMLARAVAASAALLP